MDLIADIGATNSRCALVDRSGQIARSQNFSNQDFDSLEALLRQFLGEATPDRAALAIAGPITGDNVAMLNINWHFSQRELALALGTGRLLILNDYEALAHALPRLSADDCHLVGGGQAVAGATMAVLGPGSGLGVSTAAAGPDGWTAVAGEGGHVTLPALSANESLVIADHGDANGHCSAERLLSGPGLVKIYQSLARRDGQSADAITAAGITARAEANDRLAIETYGVFFALLGTVAGNLALTVGARGGVYIAGGIVPRVVSLLESSDFRERFIGKGRYRQYLDAIPTSVIMIERPAFRGLISVLAAEKG